DAMALHLRRSHAFGRCRICVGGNATRARQRVSPFSLLSLSLRISLALRLQPCPRAAACGLGSNHGHCACVSSLAGGAVLWPHLGAPTDSLVRPAAALHCVSSTLRVVGRGWTLRLRFVRASIARSREVSSG